VEEIRQASLEKVLLDKYAVAPGELITARVYFRTFNNEVRTEEVEFTVPPLPAGSELELVVAEAAYMQQLERSLYRVQDFTPRNSLISCSVCSAILERITEFILNCWLLDQACFLKVRSGLMFLLATKLC